MVGFPMSSADVVPVEVRAVLPTSGGCAVFLGNDEKVFVIYIDQGVGVAISMFMRGGPKERPQTHDLIASILLGLGAHVERVVINHVEERVYFARLILVAENEIEEKKVLEIDARPSDSIALAVQQEAPIFVAHSVWEASEDMTEVLASMQSGEAEGPEAASFEDDDSPS